MKHKHHDKIVAKAANTGLVCFVKRPDVEWVECDDRILPCIDEHEYFLCLPQHKGAVLNSLNGGDSELSFDGEHWTDCNCNQPIEWNPEWWYMRPQSQSRIKPKKEKRWIGVNSSGYATPMTFINEDECKNYISISYQPESAPKWQCIEIEVEV